MKKSSNFQPAISNTFTNYEPVTEASRLLKPSQTRRQ